MSGFNMDDYVPVNERIDAFTAKYPDGSLQSKIVELTESRVTVMAMAYRTPDDPRPGIGHSSLEIPGKTTFTRGSEIENAETSAWGRAIAALGFEVKRGVSSAEEVRNKQPQDGERAPAVRRAGSPPAMTRPAASTPTYDVLRERLAHVASSHGIGAADLERMAKEAGVPSGQKANADQLRAIIARIESPAQEEVRAPLPPEAPEGGEGEGSASSSPTIDDVLAASGGEDITPPKPGTDEYKRLEPAERAQARAWWTEQDGGKAA